jgi:hypothetical protein
MYFQCNSCKTHAEHEWAQGTFQRQWRKVPPAHAQCVYLEECSEESPHWINLEERSEGSPHWINVSVCLSVCLPVMNTKTHRFFTYELKLGCLRGVFCPSSISSKYLFLCARRKFWFNKKNRRNLLIVYVYYQPNSCNNHAWAGGTFLRQRKKVPPAHAQRVYVRRTLVS